MSPPPLGHLVIEGTLIINSTASVNLTAVYIEIKGGTLTIATTDSTGAPVGPFAGLCTITLPGTNSRLSQAYGPDPRKTPDLVLGHELVVMGSGSLGVFGQLTIIGHPVSHSWAPLAAPAFAGNSSLVVEGALDWAAGSEVVVTPSDTDPHESEVLRVISVTVAANRESTTLHLAAPLLFDHMAQPLTQYGTRSTQLRSRVGLLTRNVVIGGEGEGESRPYTEWNSPTASAPASGPVCGNGFCELGEDPIECPADCIGPAHEYGATLLIAAYSEDYIYCTESAKCTPGFRRSFSGAAEISNLELRYYGQNNLRHGIQLSYLGASAARTRIVNTSFNRGYFGAMHVDNSSGSVLSGGTIFRAILPAVEIGSGSISNEV